MSAARMFNHNEKIIRTWNVDGSIAVLLNAE